MMKTQQLTLVAAALAGAVLAAPALADDQYRSSTPSNGAAMSPRDNMPTSPNESKPLPIREPRDPIGRGDNPNLPNPVTPSAANESAPQPQALKNEPTN